jgi:hypothetical protein
MKIKNSYSIGNFLYTIICICTAMIGYKIHGSIFWAIIDFIFCPLIWIKWIICHDVTLSIIKQTFSWFLN